MRRTFDYEPFIREFVTCLHNEGLLEDALGDRAPDTDPGPAGGVSSKAKGKGKRK